MTSAQRPLSPVVLVANALPAVVLALFGVLFYVYLTKFYTDVVGLDLTVVGIIVLVTRLWDAVTDPLIGSLSDRTRTRFGRRRPWIAAAALPLVLTFLALVHPEQSDPSAWRFFLCTFFFFLFWTMVTIPYEALGAELSEDYDERSRLFGLREGGVILGTVLAVLLPVVLGKLGELGPEPEAQRTLMARIGWLYGGLLLGALLVLLVLVPERPGTAAASTTAAVSPWELLAQNPPFRILLVAYAIGSFGAALPSTLLFYFAEHVLRSTDGPLFLLLYLGTGVLALPLWVLLPRWLEKKTAWMTAMGINSGAFAATLLLGEGDAFWFSVICVVSGIGLGGTLAIPASMQADVIDFEEGRTGERREGALVGVWSIAKKLSAALGAGIALPLLDVAGYVQPGGGQPTVVQPQAVQLLLSVLYAGVPVLCNLASIALIFRYPLGRREHAALRARLESGEMVGASR